jgi:hypothetical protein
LKKWRANLIEGITFLLIGTLIIIYNFHFIKPIDIFYNGNQQSTLNPTFVLLFMAGFFFIGAGIAQAAITTTIHNLEKK